MKKSSNILMIQADQLRFDCIGAHGINPVKTPVIDSLAREGTDFVNAFTPLPVCCPSRQSMLRGRRPETFGALWNYNIALPVGALSPDDYAFPKELRDSGYNTCHIGKWSINPVHGPDKFGYLSHVSDSEYNLFRKNKYKDDFRNGFFGEEDPVPVFDCHTHWVADKAVEFIDNTDDSWFLHIDFSEPHLPCRPAKPFSHMYDPKDIRPWQGFFENFENKPYIQKQQLLSWGIENMTWDDWSGVVANYFGIISQMDDAVGKIISTLKKKDIYNNTFIIFTSDHGDMCGSHRMMDKHYVLYDDLVKIPLIIKGTDSSKCPVYEGFVTHSLDSAPTILEMAGIVSKNKDFQGNSILPCIMGSEKDNQKDYVVSTYNGQQFGLYTQRMVRSNEYKYIWNAADVDEFYDLKNDPGELNNIIRDEKISAILIQMRNTLYMELIEAEDPLFVNNQWIQRQFEENRIF